MRALIARRAQALALMLLLACAASAPGQPVPERADDANVPVVKARKSARIAPWRTFAFFGGGAVLIVAVTFTFLNSRKRTSPPPCRRASPARLQPVAAPLTSPPQANGSAASTAICAPSLPALCPESSPSPHPAPALHAREPHETNFDLGAPTGVVVGYPRVLPSDGPEALPPLPRNALTLPASPGPVSRGPSVRCGHCKRTVPAELGMPPWCPGCGADLKPTAGDVANDGRTAAVVFGAEPEAVDVSKIVAPRLQPPYFIGRKERTYRVYILPSKLLFLDAPALDDRSPTERTIQGVAMHFGLIGYLIGSSVTSSIAGERRRRTLNRQAALDITDTEELVYLADHESTSFRIDVGDVTDVRIEALTLWQRLFGDRRVAARLQLTDAVSGPMTVDLPSPDDVRIAIKQFTALLGERLTVDVAWDWAKNRYLRRH